MSILSKASLVQIPSGYGEDKLYSEVPNTTAGDFTFTRASTGTRVNSDGYIEEVPWNKLTYSEDFSSWGTWRQGAALPVTVTTDVAESPIGTLTADRIQCDQVSLGSPNRVGVRQDVAFAPLQRFTISVWAKSASGSDESFKIIARNATGITGGAFIATNEWQKFSRVVEMRDPAVTVNVIIGLFQNTDTTTTDIYLWGAQIVLGETEKPYIKTTDRLDIPRLDYSGGASCPTLLLEGQRTNLVTYSEDFTTSWTGSVTPNVETAPNGTLTASLLANGSNLYRFFNSGSQILTYTLYAKSSDTDLRLRMRSSGSRDCDAVFDLVNGVVLSTMTNGWTDVEASMELLGDYYRCRFTATAPSGQYNNQTRIFAENGTSGVYIWGAMLEQGSFPTSYIPTSGTSVTRVGDFCGDAGDATIFNSSEGVLFFEAAALADDLTNRGFALSDGTSNNACRIYYANSTNNIRFFFNVGGNAQVIKSINLTDITDYNKIAFSYKQDDFKVYINGVKVEEDTSGIVPSANTFNKLSFDRGYGGENFYGKCKQLIYFNEALTDDELETLTTTL